VLDPVLVNRSPKRLAFAQQLIKHHPSIIRANPDEIQALTGKEIEGTEFARSIQTVIAQTGQPDIVTDGNYQTKILNGHKLMTHVTGLGCATSALVAAFAAVTDNVSEAAASALVVMGIASEIATETATGPGSLQYGILDCLYNLTNDQITQRSTIE
jgi:hydroxyethylthiazole kinase